MASMVTAPAASRVQSRAEANKILPLLTQAEHRLLFAWSDTAARTPGGCMHELFEHAAASVPDAIAVTDENTQLSFAEVNRRAGSAAGRRW